MKCIVNYTRDQRDSGFAFLNLSFEFVVWCTHSGTIYTQSDVVHTPLSLSGNALFELFLTSLCGSWPQMCTALKCWPGISLIGGPHLHFLNVGKKRRPDSAVHLLEATVFHTLRSGRNIIVYCISIQVSQSDRKSYDSDITSSHGAH